MSENSMEAPAFEGPVVIGAIQNIAAPAEIGVLTAKAVHYPGAQQLVLWLPQSGYEGYGELSLVGPESDIVERASVRSRLNGSVQILWDTLSWPPGAYRIEIAHGAGWRHVLELQKLPEGAAAPAPEIAPAEAEAGPR